MNPPTLSRSDAPTDFSARLLPLCDGRPGLRGTMAVEVRDPVGPVASPGEPVSDNSCNSCLDFVSSDETLDRYGEIIQASGWKLSSYNRNPVFQNAHQYGDVIFTLGKALITEIRSGPPREAPRGLSTLSSQPSTYLFQRIQFATDVNPIARVAHGLYRGKFLNAVSVGFIPLRWENGTQETAFRRKYLEQELLEVSAVAIPANPNALALGLKSGAVQRSDLTHLADLIHHTLGKSESSWTAPAERSGDGALDLQIRTQDNDRLVSFAKSLHSILRS